VFAPAVFGFAMMRRRRIRKEAELADVSDSAEKTFA
jgi:hypothetical protein